MDRWAACPGSVRLSKDLPNLSSVFAAEGTRAHDLAAKALLSEPWTAENDEMAEAIGIYWDFVQDLFRDNPGCYTVNGGALLVEHRFDLSKLHPGLFGTADCVVWNPSTEVLTVIDFKYGAGIPVEAVGNQQAQYYALGAMHSLGYEVSYVDIVIVQPRCYHAAGPVRTWRIDVFDLLEFQAVLLAAAKATEAPDAPLATGDQCRFCPAAATCPQVKRESFALAAKVFSPVAAYDPEDLSRTLDKIDVIEGWCSSVRAFAYGEAQRGRVPPGYKLVDKRPVRKWVDDSTWAVGICDRILRFDQRLSADNVFEEPKLKSPAQIEKILKGYGIKDALGELVVKASSGVKLVRESEPGEPVNTDPSSVFQPIELDPFS